MLQALGRGPCHRGSARVTVCVGGSIRYRSTLARLVEWRKSGGEEAREVASSGRISGLALGTACVALRRQRVSMSRTPCALTGQYVPCLASSSCVSSLFSAPCPVGKSFAPGLMQFGATTPAGVVAARVGYRHADRTAPDMPRLCAITYGGSSRRERATQEAKP
jgi:hypothetical protein